MPQADLSALGPVLILAPVGRDAAEIGRVLGGSGIPAEAVSNIAALCQTLRAQGGADFTALVIAEEAFAGGTGMIAACLETQPPWSDFPIVVLTAARQQRRPGERWAHFEGLGNVTLLNRPLHAETLLSAARAAVRSRVRQHETKQHLERLRLAAETLEARVEERTRELMALEQTLRQAQKMEAVGQLTGGIAHDFNNLLTGISGSLELLQTRIAQGRTTEVGRYVNAAQASASRAAALTHRLLAFSRRQTLDPKPTDVDRLVAGMEELIRRTMGPAITVEAVVAGGLWITLVDPSQLENALLNLCINARDAMPRGGRLKIETSNKCLDEKAARDRGLPAGPYVTLCVSDDGTGMSPEVKARAFDPFFTTKPIGLGTGLGLSMIYGFAQQSGGDVRISSEVGLGTNVCLYLPRHHGAVEEADQLAERSNAPRAEPGETVLVVDDEPVVRMLVTEVLKDLGYMAIEAADGKGGVEVLQSDARIDLLVTDVGLPGGMNGRQVADAARALRPGLNVLFITGFAENTLLSDGHLPPGMHVLTKPFAMETLTSRVKDLVTVQQESR